jgi:hypothetical protein
VLVTLCVVHLAWGPLGIDMFRGFATAYRQQPPSRAVRLVVALNDIPSDDLFEYKRLAEQLGAHTMAFSKRYDLQIYKEVAAEWEESNYLFLNSYSRPLTPNWAGLYEDALNEHNVGIVGATGSWGTLRSSAPWLIRGVKLPPHKQARLQTATIGRATRTRMMCPPAPNPFIRTNAFAIARNTYERLTWPSTKTKYDTLVLEAGRRSLTRRIQRLGLRAVVINRHGTLFDADDWPNAKTWASSGQRDLLISDNRTREYDGLPDDEKRRWAELTWPGHYPGTVII